MRTDFETTFLLDFGLFRSHDMIFVKIESEGKIEWKIVLCDGTLNLT